MATVRLQTRTERVWRMILLVSSGLVLAFLVAPSFAIVPLSVNDSQFLTYPMRGLTLRWYEDLFGSARWGLSVKNSFFIASAAAMLATFLGTLAAIGLQRASFRGKDLLNGMLLSPMVVPIVIYGVGLYFFFAPLGLTSTYTGIILAHAALGSPFVVVTVTATLSTFDWTMVRAAQSLGARPWTIFRKVMLPLIAPGVASGALFAFATSFDEVVTIILIGGPHRTIPREMFSSIRESISPTIAAAATLMTATAVALLLTLEWLKRRSRRLKAMPAGPPE